MCHKFGLSINFSIFVKIFQMRNEFSLARVKVVRGNFTEKFTVHQKCKQNKKIRALILIGQFSIKFSQFEFKSCQVIVMIVIEFEV